MIFGWLPSSGASGYASLASLVEYQMAFSKQERHQATPLNMLTALELTTSVCGGAVVPDR